MARARTLRILAVVLVLAVVQGVVVLAISKVEREREQEDQPAFLVERVTERPAPDLELLHPDGSRRSLRMLAGTTVVLHFWATWCPPCREELPHLLALGRGWAEGGELRVVAVSLDTDWAAVREFFGGDIPAEIVLASPQSATERYGVSTLPDTYVIDAEGSMRLRWSGARDWRAPAAREMLREIAGGTTP